MKTKKMTHLSLLGLALTLVSGTSFAAVSGINGDGCKTLIAGQNIDAGDVCLAVEGDNLQVTYTTQNGWQLTEAHLWTGSVFADIPMTKQGNPRIGRFPYQTGNISGANNYTFSVPLSSLSADCGINYYLAAHAALRKDNGDGSFQNETGWGGGDRMVEKGSWAMYSSYQFSCGAVIEADPVAKTCETAFALGESKLWDIENVATGDPITNRWGWQITASNPSAIETPIYAGAGGNDINKGTEVGLLTIDYASGLANVKFDMGEGFTMDETHLYVGATDVQTGAPGQFGNTHSNLNDAVMDSFGISINSNPIYVVAHAVVCSTNWPNK